MTDKICARCLLSKSRENDFSKGPRYADGYQSYCKNCMREYRAARRADPAYVEEKRKKGREYYHQNRDVIAPKRRAYDRKRWHTDPDHRRRKNQWKSDHYHADPKFRAKRNEWDRRRYKRIKSDPENREKRKVRARWWAHVRRARIRLHNNPARISQAEWTALCEHYGHKCLACGATGELVADHVVPIARGGTNTIDNIQPLCRPCNAKKYAKTIDYRPNFARREETNPPHTDTN